MAEESLRIPKREKQVVLWVHPEGRVVGSLFLHLQSLNHPGEEEPLEVLNEERQFVVLKRDDPEEIRFYNRSSIVRVEYHEDHRPPLVEARPMGCRLHMMDGSLIEGTVMKSLPPDRARLFDFLNIKDERFVKIYSPDGDACLVNKGYIIYVSTVDDVADAG